MSAVVVNIHLGGLVVVQLLPDVCFILQQQVEQLQLLDWIGSK